MRPIGTAVAGEWHRPRGRPDDGRRPSRGRRGTGRNWQPRSGPTGTNWSGPARRRGDTSNWHPRSSPGSGPAAGRCRFDRAPARGHAGEGTGSVSSPAMEMADWHGGRRRLSQTLRGAPTTAGAPIVVGRPGTGSKWQPRSGQPAHSGGCRQPAQQGRRQQWQPRSGPTGISRHPHPAESRLSGRAPRRYARGASSAFAWHPPGSWSGRSRLTGPSRRPSVRVPAIGPGACPRRPGSHGHRARSNAEHARRRPQGR
jgi:hypothetical protein